MGNAVAAEEKLEDYIAVVSAVSYKKTQGND